MKERKCGRLERELPVWREVGFRSEHLKLIRGRAQFYIEQSCEERALMMVELLIELEGPAPSLIAWEVELLMRLGRSTEALLRVEQRQEGGSVCTGVGHRDGTNLYRPRSNATSGDLAPTDARPR